LGLALAGSEVKGDKLDYSLTGLMFYRMLKSSSYRPIHIKDIRILAKKKQKYTRKDKTATVNV